MNKLKEQINYWKQASKRDLQTAQSLFKLKRYDTCLFFCHLSLEKTLKGLVTQKTKKAAPYIHDLAELAKTAGLELSYDRIRILRIINSFNIAGRYDNIKLAFYKKCTKNYTEKYINISKEQYLWLKKQYQKK